MAERHSDHYQSGEIGAGGDVSIGMDLATEAIFVEYLSPFGQIDSEESGIIGDGKSIITIDPLDGSSNFRSHFPYFGSSIAYAINDDVKVGIVANLAEGVLFVKTKEYFYQTSLDQIDFQEVQPNPYAAIGIFERAYASTKYAKKLQNSMYKYRSPGATALSLAYAHQVQFFIYEGQMRSYDKLAGLFMCETLYQHKTKDLTLICNELKHFENLKKILL